MAIAIQARMNTIIETLAAQMRQPISIAFILARDGYFPNIDSALAYVDRNIGNVPHRRN